MTSQLRILVVEDEWLIAAETEEMLQEEGWCVLGPVPTVRQALDIVRADQVDVALLDIHLGPETSFPVADALGEAGVPFMFLTGFTASDLPERYRTCPLMTKPPDRDALLKELARLTKTCSDRS